MDSVLKFAKEHGYQSAKPRGRWNDYNIFEMILSDDHDSLHVGIPQFILDDGKELRISEYTEAFEILDRLDGESG